MIVAAAWERVARDEPLPGRVDRGQLVLCLHVDEHAPRYRVVLDVSRLAAEADCAQAAAAARIGDDLFAAGLIGDEDLVIGGVVGDPVWVASGGDAAQDMAASLVDRHQFARIGCRCVDAVKVRYDKHAVNTRQSTDRPGHVLPLDVEDDDRTCCQMRDEEPIPLDIE